jgi:hypothetical protein
MAALATAGEGGAGARSIGVSPGIGPVGNDGGGSLASVDDGGGPDEAAEVKGLLPPAHAPTAAPMSAIATILGSIRVPFPSPDSAT